jgi:hypothetical protein
MGSLVVIDTEAKTISNQISPELAMVGANPMRILPNGNVMFNVVELDKNEFQNLFITLE